MNDVTQSSLPRDMWDTRSLPGIQPVQGTWLAVDDAYAGQMALRDQLLDTVRDRVVAQPICVLEPAKELLDIVLEMLPEFGFAVCRHAVECPDGRVVRLERADPLGTLGRLVQCDFCLHDSVGDEHVMHGAVLCFPARWTLAEKIGKPLRAIHRPVDEYDDSVARRVQRLFDGVQVGRPLWRINQNWYDTPTLFAPLLENEECHMAVDPGAGTFLRAERQTIFRLPLCRWVVFAIHTVFVPFDVIPQHVRLRGFVGAHEDQ